MAGAPVHRHRLLTAATVHLRLNATRLMQRLPSSLFGCHCRMNADGRGMATRIVGSTDHFPASCATIGAAASMVRSEMT